MRSIGISNFNHKQVQRILDECDIVPATNQVQTTGAHITLSSI